MNKYRKKLYAGSLVLSIVVLVTVTLVSFNSGFVSSVPVIVISKRAGLLMNDGAKVQFRGLDIGRVTSVEKSGEFVRLVLGVDPDLVGDIPGNAAVKITSSTVFGGKFVSLEDPPEPDGTKLSAGATINASEVTVEINTVFQRLTGLLRQIEPEKLNVTISALAQALGDGRGASLGTSISELDAYLAVINDATPELKETIGNSADAIAVYEPAAPALVDVLGNVTTTAKTITDEKSNIDLMLVNVLGLARSGTDLLRTNESSLTNALRLLTPTTKLLKVYSPEFTCLIQGIDTLNKKGARALGGQAPGVTLDAGFLAGVPLYGKTNLPKVAASGGPRCMGLPNPNPDERAPFLVTDTGVNPYADEPSALQVNPENLLTNLLGQRGGGN